jgi:dGTPase
MDLADDIAYSAYDLEDTMEAGIIAPFDFVSTADKTLERITTDVNMRLPKHYPSERVTEEQVLRKLATVFGTILTYADTRHPYDMTQWVERTVFVGRSHNEALLHARNHLVRRQFLETLIEGNIGGISIQVNRDQPFLSKLTIDFDRLLTIECMKAFNFHTVIASRKLQIPHHRGKHIVKGLFQVLEQDNEGALLSEVQRIRLHNCGPDERMRLIADVIASLTDIEAVRLFHRLNGGAAGSVFDYT